MRKLLLIALAFLAIIPLAGAQGLNPGEAAFSVLHQFYSQRNYKDVWVDDDHFTARARTLPKILAAATEHGLDPEAYGLSKMKLMLTDEKPQDPQGWKQAEIFWTYNAYAYASDLFGQKLDAVTLESVLDGDVADNFEALAPDNELYRALQERLAELNAAGPATQAAFDFRRGLFKPGMQSPMVPQLRARMISYGAFDELPAETNSSVYDANLAKAVGRFQHEYGLTDDGSIGPATLALLNRGPEQEREQIIANLQRLREPHRRLREDKRIEVSIARFWLTGYEGGREAISMPVVVGQPRRQTISFRTEITGVRLNPTWSVPATIKREDFIPGLLSDPAKLMRKHPVKVVHAGQLVDPTQVDWTQFTPRELMQVSFTQPSGDGNPLGRYRVIMSNPYDIYLHDTNHPELFKLSMRAQSSGCVRVARPDDLAAFILKGKTGWDPQKTAKVVTGNQTTDVVIENKIPIYLDYMTAWFNDRRQLILGTDVYALDKPRYEILVKNGQTTQRNAQKILSRVTDILEPELKEAQHTGSVLTQSTN